MTRKQHKVSASMVTATVGDLDITSPTIITGAGARKTTVVGIPPFDDKIFENGETTTRINGISITGGNGFIIGDVENNTGTLTLDEVAIYLNVGSFGGGVASYANSPLDSLTIINSAVSHNQRQPGPQRHCYTLRYKRR